MVENEPHDLFQRRQSAPRKALEFVIQDQKRPPDKAEIQYLKKSTVKNEPDDRNRKCKSPVSSEFAAMFVVANSNQDADKCNQLEQNVQNSFIRIFENLIICLYF